MSLAQEGYLFKRGDVVKRWNLRYFMLLVSSQPTLVYYRKVGEAPANALPIGGAKVQISGTAKGGSLFHFTVQASGETYELAATTQQERRRWVDQLLQAASKQTPAMQSPPSVVTDGHLLAPSPLGVDLPQALFRKKATNILLTGLGQASDDRELHRGSLSPSPSPLGRRSSTTQEAVPTMRLQSLGGDLPDPPGAQLPIPSTAQRARQPLGSSSLSGQRSGQPVGSRSPTKGSSTARPGRTSHPESQRGSDADSMRSFSLRSSSGSVKRSLLASLSASFRNAIVPPHPSDMASSLSDTESLDTLGLAPSSPYTASLQPLRQGQASPTAALLAPDALLEQFERAQQYVARHPEDFSLERLSSLQDWCEAAKSQGRSKDAGMAASAMYVLQVTQTSPMWAIEHDTAFISPDGMIRSVQNCPSASMLMDLKDCLDFCSNSWVSLYCRQGGIALLLQCMHALMSSAGGMHSVLSTCGSLPALCAMLARPGENEAAKLVVEMLIKLCLFSTEGYCLAIKTLLGRLAPAAEHSHQQAAPMTTRPAGMPSQALSGSASGSRASAPAPPPPPKPPGTAQNPSSHRRPPPSPPPPPPPKPPGSVQKPSPCPTPIPPPPPPPRPPGLAQRHFSASGPPPSPPPPPPPKPPGSGQRPAAPTLAIPATPVRPAIQEDSPPEPNLRPAGTPAQSPPASPPPGQQAGRSPSGQKAAAVQVTAQSFGGTRSEPVTGWPSAGLQAGEASAAVSGFALEDAAHSAPEYCTALLTLLKVSVKVTADMDLADHLLSFLNAALSSPEAQHALPLRKAFVLVLLDLGLLNVLADISGMLDTYMDASVHLLRTSVKGVIAVPKPEPLPAPKVSPPPPPPARLAKPTAPPPPPPPGGRKVPLKPLAPAEPRVDPGPKPSKKLKAFFWDVLPESRVPGTFWAANVPAYSSLDTQEVEDLFQAAQAKKAREKKLATKQLAILDVKRATGIGIRMSGLRAPANEVAEAVRKLDTQVLCSAEEARAILACAPAAEERKMFRAFLRSGGKPEALSDAESFCLELMQVPCLEERLSTYASSFEAAQQLEEALAVLAVHVDAQVELRASECFAVVLARTLAFGNFLNWGSRLGQAAGFRLKNLPKLQDTRTADGRTNMLRYLAERLVSEEPPQAVLSMQLPHVLSAPLKTSLAEASEMVERANMALTQIRTELQNAGSSVRLQLSLQPDSGLQRITVLLHCDNYSDVLATSAQGLSKSLAAAKEQLQQARRGFEALVAYFGENPMALQNDGDFWRDVIAFVTAFSTAQQGALVFKKEQQARLARQRSRTGSVPAGTTWRSHALPDEAQPRLDARASQHVSAGPDTGQEISVAAVQGVLQSSGAAVPLQRAKAGQKLLPPALIPPTSRTEADYSHLIIPRQAATRDDEDSRCSRAANKDGDGSGPGLVHRNIASGLGRVDQLCQKHEPVADQVGQAAQAEGTLIQAVPEMPDRRASLGWPDANKGVNIVRHFWQMQGSPDSKREEVPPYARESIVEDASEADLEALLGQLVNRAAHI